MRALIIATVTALALAGCGSQVSDEYQQMIIEEMGTPESNPGFWREMCPRWEQDYEAEREGLLLVQENFGDSDAEIEWLIDYQLDQCGL